MHGRVAILLVCAAAGCSSPGPTPAEWAARELPEVALDAAGRRQVLTHENAAIEAMESGRWDLARQRADAALAIDPRAAVARAVLGRALLEDAMRDSPPVLALAERAEGELLLARRLAGSDPFIELLYARFLEVDGQLSLAAEVLDDVLVTHPDHVACLRAAARLRFELGQERRAAAALSRLLQHRPAETPSVYRYAHCQMVIAEAIARGDTEEREGVPAAARAAFLEAAKTWQAYQKLAPRDLQGHLGEAKARFRALVVIGAGDHAEPEAEQVKVILEAAARIDPKAPEPPFTLAVLREHMTAVDGAQALYERALRLDPDHLPAILNLAHLLDARGKKVEAAALCRRALKGDVPDEEARRLRAYLAGNNR